MRTSDHCDQPCFHPATINRVKAGLAEARPESAEITAARFAALANPQRLTILRALRISELCVCDLAYVLGLSTGATSQQLRVLRQQGWLSSRRDGKQVYYRLHDDHSCSPMIDELTAFTQPSAAIEATS